MFKNFTNQYQLSKTLRFELKPIGKTLEHIEQKELIGQDEERSEDYKRVKELIDEYHKVFISEALHGLALTGIERYEELYFKAKKDDKEQKEFADLQGSMRKEIAKQFTKHPQWSNLFAKELIKVDLINSPVIQNEADRTIVDKFKDFTTYFGGFHDNRKNMYSDEDKHTAIAYRIVHENLPIFLSNKRIFEKIAKEYPEIIQETKAEIEPHLLGAVFEDMFTHQHFSLTMGQIYIDEYNTMVGGAVLPDGTKIQGFNEKINLFRQKNGVEKRQLPNLKPLYKQILSDRESLSWLPEAFETDADMLSGIQKYYDERMLNFECCDGKVNILERLKELFEDYSSFDKSKIFIKNDRSITDISQAIFSDYSVVKEALWSKYLADTPQVQTSKAKKPRDLSKEEEKFFKAAYFSLSHTEEALRLYLSDNEKHKDKLAADILLDYFKTNQVVVSKIQEKYKAAADLLNSPYPQNSKLQQSKKDVTAIKEFLDALLDLQRFLKPLNVQTDSEKDVVFYAAFDTYFAPLSGVARLYDKVRNYLTKKPYSLEKFKLNFENSTLLDGWDVNKEPDNTAVLFRKDGLYYLGIMDKGHNRILKSYSQDASADFYEKIEYKQIALPMGVGAFVRKCTGTASQLGWNLPENCKNSEGKIIIKEDEVNGNLTALIDCYKDFFDKYEKDGFKYKKYGFIFKKSEAYTNLKEFFLDVEQQGYKITYRHISKDYIDELVDSGKLYLFQIYNKDFSPYSKGTPNMHTLYWKMLFDENNLRDVVYKLNGQAEIFYRKKSIEYSEEKLKSGHHHEELKGKFCYPIIANRRFAMDKFQFHVPITLNFKATGNDNINPSVNEFIQNNHSNVKVIGIDRGERHLLYISMIDSSGKIILQESLNKIVNSYNDKEHTIDYHQKLQDREDDRAKARTAWKNIETIKELKEGYMSQVIHLVASLMVEHDAIVVLEDLNFGFKQGRFKVEKQVYQKFEKMLIDKLNYLVDKKKRPDELGGTQNALQLTSKFESFEKMGKQSGFLYYVPAWNTSKIDPTTGFVSLFDTKYSSVEKAKEFFGKFKSIRYNKAKDYFEFEADNYTSFNAKAEGTRQDWTICTHGDRVKNFRNKDKNNSWDWASVDPTEELKNIFGADYDTAELKAKISAQDDKKFFESLLYFFKLTLQMRNSVTGTDIDYLISPVMNAKGEFYDSRKADSSLPRDADANGAYNIARKGLMLIERIKEAEDIKKPNLVITNKDWLEFAQR